jgi:hypothetical protein
MASIRESKAYNPIHRPDILTHFMDFLQSLQANAGMYLHRELNKSTSFQILPN